MKQINIETTKGPFICRPTHATQAIGYLTICQDETNEPLALVLPKFDKSNLADAAMFAAAPHALEALIEIQSKLMTSKETIDLEEINDIISQVFEKIAAESDVTA
jgi:hypothetical protein